MSTEDNKWGKKWEEIPRSLRIYGTGDDKFGHMTYVILSAIVVADWFPDPDIACKFLQQNQGSAVQLVLDLLMKVLYGGRSR